MTPLNYLNTLTVCILAVASTVSCQTKKQNASTTTDKKIESSTRIFGDSLPKPVGYVNDYENIFSDREEKVLDSLIGDFENRTTIQIAVITFDTTMTTEDSLDALTLRFANDWGVGQKDKDNGVTIGISKGYRRMRIQNAYGIEKVLTDKETSEIIDTAFIPGFRETRYFAGTFNGLITLMKILEQRVK